MLLLDVLKLVISLTASKGHKVHMKDAHKMMFIDISNFFADRRGRPRIVRRASGGDGLAGQLRGRDAGQDRVEGRRCGRRGRPETRCTDLEGRIGGVQAQGRGGKDET